MTGHTVPVGTISIRKASSGVKVRMIKVRDGGPISGRWIDFARFWWLENRGPVPDGKRVCHLDGNTLNDDPSNFGLLTPGDVIFLAHERDPKMSERNRRNCSDATAEMNRMRGLIGRATGWLPSLWYAVDFARKLIHNEPHRERWRVYQAAGVECDSSSWRQALATAMGWPGRILLDACILTVLADTGPLPIDELLKA